MKKIIFFVGCFLFFQASTVSAQTVNQFNSWWTYTGNHKVSEKISVHTLYSWRRNNFVKDWQQSLLRLGINYRFSDKFSFTPGYDWVVTFPYGEQPIGKETTEQRIFGQFVVKNKLGKVKLSHRYRFEERFSNKTTKQRFRYKLGVSFPLSKINEKLFLSFSDEMFLNFGKNVGAHFFDQNWLYGGMGYQLKKNAIIKLGYMNQYFVKSDNIHIENNHTLQVGLVYNLDFYQEG